MPKPRGPAARGVRGESAGEGPGAFPAQQRDAGQGGSGRPWRNTLLPGAVTAVLSVPIMAANEVSVPITAKDVARRACAVLRGRGVGAGDPRPYQVMQAQRHLTTGGLCGRRGWGWKRNTVGPAAARRAHVEA
jgi:hypothetical protein